MAVIVQDSCALVGFNQRFLVQRLANVVHATGGFCGVRPDASRLADAVKMMLEALEQHLADPVGS